MRVLLAQGRRLAGRYRLEEKSRLLLCGQLWHAWDEDLDEAIDLLAFPPERSSAEGLEELRAIFNRLRRFHHIGCQRLFDFAVDDTGELPVAFMTLERLSGPSLDERLGESERISTETALPILQQLGTFIDAAHEADLVHGSLRPRCVILEGERIVVLELGLRTSSNLDADATIASNELTEAHSYLAPEQVSGSGTVAASDRYALGLIAYRMLSGQLPFRGASPLATAALRLSKEPETLSRVVAGVPQRWEVAVMKALRRRPEDRLASAAELLEGLGAKTQPRPRRSGRLIAAAATAAAIIAAIFLLQQPANPREVLAALDGPPRIVLFTRSDTEDPATARVLEEELMTGAAGLDLHFVSPSLMRKMAGDLTSGGLAAQQELAASIGANLTAELTVEPAGRSRSGSLQLFELSGEGAFASLRESGQSESIVELANKLIADLAATIESDFEPTSRPDLDKEVALALGEGLRLAGDDRWGEAAALVAVVLSDRELPRWQAELALWFEEAGSHRRALAEIQTAQARAHLLGRVGQLRVELAANAIAGRFQELGGLLEELRGFGALDPELALHAAAIAGRNGATTVLDEIIDTVAADFELERISLDLARARWRKDHAAFDDLETRSLELRLPRLEARLLAARCAVEIASDLRAQAEQSCSAARGLAEEIGLAAVAAHTDLELARLRRREGRAQAAIDFAESALEASDRLGDRRLEIESALILAALVDDAERRQALHELAIEIAASEGLIRLEGDARAAIAEEQASAGELEAALESWETALDAARIGANLPLEARCLQALIDLSGRLEDEESADSYRADLEALANES